MANPRLITHAGGWEASKADLASVPVPQETSTYMPIPYPRLIQEIEENIPRFGMKITSEKYALAREGQQMFGVMTLQNGSKYVDWTLALGIRTSYDSSLAVGLVMGHQVFVCDNLAFSGEVSLNRKHTLNLFRDLPYEMRNMLEKAQALNHTIEMEIEGMKGKELTIYDADHLLMESVRRDVIPASNLPKVIEQWETPEHEDFKPRTAWSLHNAFTHVLKSKSPALQMQNSLRLSKLFQTA